MILMISNLVHTFVIQTVRREFGTSIREIIPMADNRYKTLYIGVSDQSGNSPKMILISPTVVISMGRNTISSSRDMTSIPCRPYTRDLVKSMKRGGITYDTLLLQFVEQYDPEVVHE